jgi:CheY-like chemotaxis protein
MANAKIMVVEDENIVAMEIQSIVESLGYAVSAVASSGEEAIRKAAETRPDLVLMDIKLKGDMDGIETAGQIRARFNIPAVYLTAYADENTLQRAKITEPYGIYSNRSKKENYVLSLRWLFTSIRLRRR